jgi:hypothetical protein
MIPGLVLLLLVSACCARPTTFADFLASKTDGAVAAVQGSSEYSQPREHEMQCIKQINNKNCRVIGGTNDIYYFE